MSGCNYVVELNHGPYTLTYHPGTVSVAVAAAAQPPAIQVPASGIEYFVYRCSPTVEHPMDHWKFYPATTCQSQLPDIREARPLYVFSSVTGQYTAVNQIGINWK